MGIGILGAGLFAYYFGAISDWLDGVGQEISNAGLLLMVVIFLIGICVWIAKYSEYSASQNKPFGPIKALLIGAVSIAVIREGAEIFVYVQGFFDSLESFLPIFVGGSIGAGIGLSIGALIYYLLINLPRRAWLHLTLAVLTLIAAGMSSQVALNLIQAGWLPSQMPIWDTSRVLPETSVLGQLLYASLGYEATPNAIQIGFFVAPIVSVVVSVAHIRRWKGQHRKTD